ncbi:hypothetical protein ACTQ54_12050 [Fundicoccus sp. Sow4_H7]|uniref:hypothetical protein n=1 Tax=Fundicoccus sp. Sow4_H7 TaxID=3438784 RepID=UPI003F90C228
MKTIIKSFTLIFLFSLFLPTIISAQAPYQSFTYDYWEDPINIPDPYLPEDTITGQDLESGSFSSPQDFAVTEEGHIYIADTGNHRIVILDNDYEFVGIIDEFENDEGELDHFRNPSGLYMSEKNELYIADTNNNRIVVLDNQFNFVKSIQNPESEILEENFVFTPLKVSVDYADRVYVISKNMYQGIMSFDEFGNFTGFSGTINVNLSFTEKVWRLLSTKEQRARQILYIPTEFTGMDIDPDGFIYTSNIDAEGLQGLRRLNPKGQDVIKQSVRNHLGGDLFYRSSGDYSGPSAFVDVLYRGRGLYSALDSKRGRIFTYDDEGNLLYIFGGIGTQRGTFRQPVALEMLGDKLLVLDALNNSILTFAPTYYGSLINEATGKRFEGDESETVRLWEEVLKLDANNEFAYNGIGKSYLTSGDNEKAVEYLSRGRDREYYSIAYKRYRNERLKESFSTILTILLITFIAYLVFRWLKQNNKLKKRKLKEEKPIKLKEGGDVHV